MRLAAVAAACLLAATSFAEDRVPALPFSVTVSGKGPAMILIPGLTCDGAVWDETVAHFRLRYECHTVTLAGFAGQPPLDSVTAEGFLPQVEAGLVRYIGMKGLQKPVIVGHSLGGHMALRMAAHHPDLVGAAIAVDGVPFLPALMSQGATEETAVPMAKMMRDQMANSPREAFLAQNKAYVSSMVKDPEAAERVADWAAASDQATVAQAMYELMSQDMRQELAEAKAPLLLVMAAEPFAGGPMKDAMVAAYEAQLAAAPGRKHTAVAEKARHFVMYDDLPFLLKSMEEFLAPEAGQ